MTPFLPPSCEHRPYPHKVASILFPAPWCVTSFSESGLTKAIFDAAYPAWLAHLGIEEAPCQ